MPKFVISSLGVCTLCFTDILSIVILSTAVLEKVTTIVLNILFATKLASIKELVAPNNCCVTIDVPLYALTIIKPLDAGVLTFIVIV